MKERERIVVGGLVTLMLVLWLGFIFHRSPRFAGSFWGGVLAVTGSSLMLVPLVYLIIKRVKRIKAIVTRYMSMRTVLAWHIYAGVIGPILVLLHTGHKFESPVGMTLTAMTLIVVLSGFTGRYLLSRIGRSIREKQAMLKQLNSALELVSTELQEHPEYKKRINLFTHLIPRLAMQFFMTTEPAAKGAIPVGMRAVQLAESISDLEYAIRTHQAFKRAFQAWLKVHILISAVLYVLLSLHIWAGIHFGLRWFS